MNARWNHTHACTLTHTDWWPELNKNIDGVFKWQHVFMFCEEAWHCSSDDGWFISFSLRGRERNGVNTETGFHKVAFCSQVERDSLLSSVVVTITSQVSKAPPAPGIRKTFKLESCRSSRITSTKESPPTQVWGFSRVFCVIGPTEGTYIQFPILCCDDAVFTAWLDSGKKLPGEGLEKDTII